MTTINDAFPSKFLAAGDMKGQDHTVTIVRVGQEKLGDDEKYVLFFQGAQKGMVINKTNWKTIAVQHGPTLEGWVGKTIIIGPAWVDFRGDTVEAIRVRPGLAQNAAEAFAPTAPSGPATRAVDTPLGQPPLTDKSVAEDLDDDIPF